MNCPNCHHAVLYTDKFCGNCNFNLSTVKDLKKRTFTNTYPAIVSILIGSLISIAAIIGLGYYFYLISKAGQLAALSMIDLSGIGSGYVTFYILAMVSIVVLPPVLFSFFGAIKLIKYNPLGYKQCLLADLYFLVVFSLVFSSSPGYWFLKLLILALFISASICLVLDAGFAKFSPNPPEIVFPAFLSKSISYLMLHGLLIVVVMIVLAAIPIAGLLSSLAPYYNLLGGQISGSGEITTAIIEAIISLVLYIVLIILFGRTYKDLMARKQKSNILGIVLFSIFALLLVISAFTNKYINFWGILFFLLIGAQIALLSLKNTKQLLV